MATNKKNVITSGIEEKLNELIQFPTQIVNTLPKLLFLNNAIKCAAKKNNTNIPPILFKELYIKFEKSFLVFNVLAKTPYIQPHNINIANSINDNPCIT